MAGRKGVPLNRYVSQEALDGWNAWCDEHGIDLGPALDVIGRKLGSGWQPSKDDVAEVVTETRALMRERKRRTVDPPSAP